MRRILLHVAAMMCLLLGFTGTSSAYYDPTSGRFLSPDPLGHEASMDLYSYASDDPINFCDPDGRCGQNSMQAMSDPKVQAYVEGLKQSNIGQTHSGEGIQPGPIQEALDQEWALIRQAIWDRSVDSSEIDNPLRFDPIGRFAAGVIRDVVDATGIGALATFYHDSYYRQEWLTGRPVTQDEATFRVLMSAATMPMMIIAPEAGVEAGLLEGAGSRMAERSFIPQVERAASRATQLEFSFVSDFTAPAKRATGTTVLGPFGSYRHVANQLGARYFYVPDEIWATMTDAERKLANKKFLDRTIARGDRILLSEPFNPSKPPGGFAWEINYMTGNNFKISADGMELLRP